MLIKSLLLLYGIDFWTIKRYICATAPILQAYTYDESALLNMVSPTLVVHHSNNYITNTYKSFRIFLKLLYLFVAHSTVVVKVAVPAMVGRVRKLRFR